MEINFNSILYVWMVGVSLYGKNSINIYFCNSFFSKLNLNWFHLNTKLCMIYSLYSHFNALPAWKCLKLEKSIFVSVDWKLTGSVIFIATSCCRQSFTSSGFLFTLQFAHVLLLSFSKLYSTYCCKMDKNNESREWISTWHFCTTTQIIE